MSDMLVADSFRDKVGQNYVVAVDVDGDGELDDLKLELVECSDLTAHDFPGKARDPFSLIFKAPPGAALPQQSYTVKNETTSEVLTLFLVPIGPGHGGLLYQAVFT